MCIHGFGDLIHWPPTYLIALNTGIKGIVATAIQNCPNSALGKRNITEGGLALFANADTGSIFPYIALTFSRVQLHTVEPIIDSLPVAFTRIRTLFY